MQVKHWLSVVTTFFLASQSKAQQTNVKKETTPQVKETLPTPIPQRDEKMMKHKNSSLPTGVKGEKALPITVKPGDQIYATRFTSDPEGDMPSGWRSNGSGAVAKIMGQEGSWLKLEEATRYELKDSLPLPENFTVSFDFLANYKDDQSVPELKLRLFRKGAEYYEPGIIFALSPNGGTTEETTRVQLSTTNDGGSEKFRSTAKTLTSFQNKNGKNVPVHVVLSVKGDVVKTWIDTEKVYDVSEVVPKEVKFDRIAFETSTYGGPKANYAYFISNISIKAD